MKKTTYFFFLLAFVITSHAIAQNDIIDHKRINPPNPDVAAVMKHVITPVNEYAGIPNIGIPLCTVQEDNINLPISLNYHSGGIQVSEESGNVGLGWSCNSGGMITRVVNGYPDFGEDPNHNEPYIHNTLTRFDKVPDPFTGGTRFDPTLHKFRRATNDNGEFPVDGQLTPFDIWLDDANGSQDFNPDKFYFNFNGYSGSFYFKPNGEIFLVEKRGLNIELNNEPGANNYSFTITTEDGTVYHFGEWAKTDTQVHVASAEYISTWYLTKITTINKREINFTYDSFANGISSRIFPMRTYVQNLWYVSEYEHIASPLTAVDEKYLTKIDFSNGAVHFNYSNEGERQDIPYAHFLKGIRVFNGNDTIKKHDFSYSYFGRSSRRTIAIENGDFSQKIGYALDHPDLNLRLRLDTVTEDDIKTHSFNYYGGHNVPNKTSMSQDVWGFYNGKPNALSFIPSQANTSIPVSRTANRTPSEPHVKLFSLKQIVSPTKGVTVFDYECNTYDPEVRDCDFYNTVDPLPTEDATGPATVSRREFAGTLQTTGNLHTQDIFPIPIGGVSVRVNIVLRGVDGLVNNPPNFNFGSDAYVKIVRKADNRPIFTRGFITEEASLAFENGEVASFSTILDFPTEIYDSDGRFIGRPELNDPQGYTLEAFFNTHNGAYIGHSEIIATWQEEAEQGTAENPKFFSLGGGIRIKSITDHDSDGSIAQKRNFNYHYMENVNGVMMEKSHGRIKTLPNHAPDHPYITRFTVTNLAGSGADPNIPAIPEAITFNTTRLIATSSSIHPLAKHQGSYVGYSEVVMSYENRAGADNGKIVSKYFNFVDYLNRGNNLHLPHINAYHTFEPIRIPHNGMLFEQEVFKRETNGAYTLLTKTENNYEINNIGAAGFTFSDFVQSSDLLLGGVREFQDRHYYEFLRNLCFAIPNRCTFPPPIPRGNSIFQFHPYYASRVELRSSITTQFNENGENPLATAQHTFYDNPVHYMPTRTETVDSEGNTITTRTWYPDDIDTLTGTLEGGGNLLPSERTAINLLKSDGTHRRIGQPIQTRITNNGETSLQRTQFRDWGNGIVLPEVSKTLKGDLVSDNSVQERMVVYSYDIHGNPLEVSGDQGPITSYIWGYHKNYVIAKIQNANYAEIAAALNLTEAALKSSGFNENDMVQLDGLRNNPALSKAFITTYAYDPMVGMTKMTDPRDYQMFYTYDAQRRLIEVKDDQNHVLTDYQYHYAGQN